MSISLQQKHGIVQIKGQRGDVEGALTIDETKFLGGDVEHTHLVKGLDYALLAKVPTPLLETCDVSCVPSGYHGCGGLGDAERTSECKYGRKCMAICQ